jgi:hypothetical protein
MLGCVLVFGVLVAVAQLLVSLLFLNLDLSDGRRVLVIISGNLIAGAIGGALVWWTILKPMHQRIEMLRKQGGAG